TAVKAGAKNPTTVMAEVTQPVYASAAGQKQANSLILAEVAQSPLMPLVFAILGILVSIGLIVLFVMLSRRSAKGGGIPPATSRSQKGSNPAEQDGPSDKPEPVEEAKPTDAEAANDADE
ncbi:MAG TPA: hypothetical protein VIK32_12540, partial [Candidatus Limnocylindrales bacterium]